MGPLYCFEYDFDRQTAAGADCDFLAIAEVGERDLELVSTWAWIGVEGCSLVIGHIFDLYLIVERHRAGSCFGGCKDEGLEESKNRACAGTEIRLVPDLNADKAQNY